MSEKRWDDFAASMRQRADKEMKAPMPERRFQELVLDGLGILINDYERTWGMLEELLRGDELLFQEILDYLERKDTGSGINCRRDERADLHGPEMKRFLLAEKVRARVEKGLRRQKSIGPDPSRLI